MARYGKTAAKKVEKTMRERKQGKLRSGSSKKKVTSRKQAIAIGLSEARRAGAKVPAKQSPSKGSSKRSSAKASSRSSSAKRSSSGKSSSRSRRKK